MPVNNLAIGLIRKSILIRLLSLKNETMMSDFNHILCLKLLLFFMLKITDYFKISISYWDLEKQKEKKHCWGKPLKEMEEKWCWPRVRRWVTFVYLNVITILSNSSYEVKFSIDQGWKQLAAHKHLFSIVAVQVQGCYPKALNKQEDALRNRAHNSCVVQQERL